MGIYICVPVSVYHLVFSLTFLIKIYNMSPKKDTVASNSPKSKDSQKNGKDSSPKNGKSSPSKKEVDADAHTAAMDLFAQGKRHLLVNDIQASVNSLQEACRMLAEQHGETSPEVGDAYFYYGRALLEMARMESDVLGLAMEGVPEGEDLDNSQVENPDKLSEEEKDEEDEDVSNHQLAWEMLELAKVIYHKQESGNTAMSLKTAQVFLKLGEVGLE